MVALFVCALGLIDKDAMYQAGSTATMMCVQSDELLHGQIEK